MPSLRAPGATPRGFFMYLARIVRAKPPIARGSGYPGAARPDARLPIPAASPFSRPFL